MKVRLLDEAENDLRDGYAFYERQNHGLGRYFLKVLRKALRALGHLGGVHQIEYGCFRAIPPHFPFKIFYVIEDGTVVVVAIIDSRRQPERIRRRLGRQ